MASLSGLGALALRRADSHWLSSFTFCRESGLGGGGQGWAATRGTPSGPILAAPHLALEVGGVQGARTILRNHLHHVRQLEGALVHALHGADVRHRDGGAHLGDRTVAAGRAGVPAARGPWAPPARGSVIWMHVPPRPSPAPSLSRKPTTFSGISPLVITKQQSNRRPGPRASPELAASINFRRREAEPARTGGPLTPPPPRWGARIGTQALEP